MPTSEQLADTEAAELVLAYAWQSFNNRVSHFDKLDAKAATLASFVGLTISLGVGFAAHLPTSHALNWRDQVVAFLLLLVLMVGLFFFLLALQTRTVKDLLPSSTAIDYLVTAPISGDNKLFLVKQFSLKLSAADDDLRGQTAIKSINIQWGVFFLKVFLVLGFLFLVYLAVLT